MADPRDTNQMTNNSMSCTQRQTRRDTSKISDCQKLASDPCMNQNPLATFQSDKLDSIEVDHSHQDVPFKKLKQLNAHSIGDNHYPGSTIQTNDTKN